jgi:predicted ATPase with chaperone activity
MSDDALARYAAMSPGAKRMLEYRLKVGGLSARGLTRVRRVARTVADLEGRDGALSEEDVATALEMRHDFAEFRSVVR